MDNNEHVRHSGNSELLLKDAEVHDMESRPSSFQFSKEINNNKYVENERPNDTYLEYQVFEWLSTLDEGVLHLLDSSAYPNLSDSSCQHINIQLDQSSLQSFLLCYDNLSTHKVSSPNLESLSVHICIKKNPYGGFTLRVPFHQMILQRLVADQVRVLVPRETLHLIRTGQLLLQSNHIILQQQELLLSNQKFSVIAEDLRVLVSNSSYKEPTMLTRILPNYRSNSFEEVISHEAIYPDSPTQIISQEITINKLEVSFLIGHQGTRIETIRRESQATIKILPISQRLKSHQITAPTSVLQQLCITGDLQAVATALSLIEYHLSHHRLNWKRKI
ncbi:LAFE_0H02916g1_1 [Lachancea fermentati]|uniref:LAFE_0H02916g1_1 n=1 Tax=Lachancea fermentati TaxID=4955 RepID=A0A1G4MJ93_LACFM|nr:LAFE_0H02916g1_1 [Lachancea fermentati]